MVFHLRNLRLLALYYEPGFLLDRPAVDAELKALANREGIRLVAPGGSLIPAAVSRLVGT